MTKICKACKRNLDVNKFNKINRIYKPYSPNCKPRHYIGLQPICCDCEKKRNREKTQKYRNLHRKEVNERARIKYDTDEYREYNRNYASKRRKTDSNYRLKDNCRKRINDALRNYGIKKSKHTMELIGCSIEKLKEHLESQFKDGMTWENHSLHGWHIDHKRPCSSFDLTNPSQQKLCFHYTNLQPLWAKDNLEKGDACL